MPFVSGFLRVRRGGHPDNSLPGGGGASIDNELPGEQPGIDNELPEIPGPVDPGFGVGLPPVIDNGLPIFPGRPGHPLPPTYPVRPDNSLPHPPTIWPKPPMPPTVWPPLVPTYPELPVYPERPDNALPLPPGAVWPPLPGVNGNVLCLVWVVGYGYRWTVIDPSLKPSNPLPGGPGLPDNSLPNAPVRPTQPIAPTPEPRR